MIFTFDAFIRSSDSEEDVPPKVLEYPPELLASLSGEVIPHPQATIGKPTAADEEVDVEKLKHGATTPSGKKVIIKRTHTHTQNLDYFLPI